MVTVKFGKPNGITIDFIMLIFCTYSKIQIMRVPN